MSTRISGVLAAVTVLMTPALKANIVGSDLENFNPAASSMDGVTTTNAFTLGQGRFGLGLFINHETNSLPYFKDENGGDGDTSKAYNDSITTLDAQLVYGLTDYWDIHFEAPYVISQAVGEEEELHGEYERKGGSNLRFGTKVRVLQAGPFAVGLIANTVYNRVIDNPHTGHNRWPATTLEAAASLKRDRLMITANAGYRWRRGSPASAISRLLPVERYGDQIVYSLGAALPFTKTWSVTGEIYGATNRDDYSDDSDRATTIAEALGGLRYDVTPSIEIHAGLGGEMRHSISSADARYFTGIRWTVGDNKTAVAAKTVASKAVVERRPDLVIDLDDVTFKFDSVEFRQPKSQDILARLSSVMAQHQNIERVVIEGHTCDLGSEMYNLNLSDRRASTVEAWLVKRYGISDAKLQSVGWGKMHPKVDNISEANRRENRRVSFKVYLTTQDRVVNQFKVQARKDF